MSNSARKRKKTKEQSKSKAVFGGLRRVELVGIGVIALAGLMYMLTKCGGNNELPPPEEIVEEVKDPIKNKRKVENPESVQRSEMIRRTLYVVIDSSKMRTGPYLDSTVVRFVRLNEEVLDMGEVSPFEQTIRIAQEEVTTERWLKVKDKYGKEGWIYGACVRPYKKLIQVQEEGEAENEE